MIKFKFLRRKETWLLIIIVVVAVILRFWRIHLLEFFTYDQARDAIYVERIVVDHTFRLLGTQTSLPGMYLPPFYYYTIIPILWLFKLNPVGIDIYSATIGVLAVILVYHIASQMFGRPSGVIASAIYSVSPLNVELSRRAWNPNTLPFFILISFYFLWLYFKNHRGFDYFLASVFYGYCLSLHFGAWTLAPIFLGTAIYGWLKKTDKKFILGSAVAIMFFIFPLLLFEIRHHFFLLSQAKIFFFDNQHLGLPNSGPIIFLESIIASILAIFTILYSGRILISTQAPFEFSGRLKDLFRFSEPISVVAQKPFSLSFQWWGLVMFLLVVGVSFWYLMRKEEKNIRMTVVFLWSWILIGVFISKFYSGSFFFFYYLFLFPAPFLLLGLLVKFLWHSSVGRVATVASFLLIYFFHLQNTTIFEKSWRDINDLRIVAQVISSDIPKDTPFNIASARREDDRWDRNAVDYHYFIETFYDRRPLDWLPQNYKEAQILYLVSENGPLDPLSSPIMEVKEFSPQKILKTWELPKSVVIYKLGR